MLDKITKTPLPSLFLLRELPKDPHGLSVDIESAAACSKTLNECFGVVSLHTGRVRDLGLDVVADEAPHHANITGLPRKELNPAEAHRMASQLAKLSRVVPSDQCSA